jgi:hypothetical protein
MRQGRPKREAVLGVFVACATALSLGGAAATAAVRGPTPGEAMKHLTARAQSGFGNHAVLPAGRYHMTKFASAYHFALTKTTPAAGVFPWFTELTIAGSNDHPTAQIEFWSGSLDFLKTGVKHNSLTDAKADASVPRTPAGVLGWLMANPGLVVSGRTSVTVGGVKGTEIVIRAKQSANYATDLCGGSKCVPLLVTPPLKRSRAHGDWISESADSESPVRMVILTVHGTLLLITTDVYSGDIEQQSRLAKRVLSTVRFD